MSVQFNSLPDSSLILLNSRKFVASCVLFVCTLASRVYVRYEMRGFLYDQHFLNLVQAYINPVQLVSIQLLSERRSAGLVPFRVYALPECKLHAQSEIDQFHTSCID